MAQQQKLKKSLFLAAIEIETASARNEFLDQECGDNQELRNEIVSLLDAHDDPPEVLGRLNNALPTINQDSNEVVGKQIGPYKLLESIGEGGMGTVYMAQQNEPVKRRVALKLIKPGMDSKQVCARFDSERQALAMMDHPSIAKIHDGGSTESGRPFFVMELVKGLPITEFCDKQKLSTNARLKLFRQVCHAVQHAHQKGIIHRDLKPSNILIAMYDDVPVPKVIDFGVAKATCEPLTEDTFFTRFGEVVGTLTYMSPEQAQFNQLDIDTRSDIYSLGAMLYELLVGEPPFDKDRLKSQAFDETLRMIREEEPTKPSTKLTSTEQAAKTAINRSTTTEKLSSTIRGDLDWIVMKALQKNRSQRYETANGFAADVNRYLTNEPVLARPPSVRYRFRQFARRNKVVMTFASLVLFGLTAGVIGLAISNQIIFKEKKLAQLNYRVAMRTLDELVDQAAQFERMVDLEGWRRTTLERGLDHYTQFASQNAIDPDLSHELLKVREKQAKIHLLLENFEQAEATAQSGIDLVGIDSPASIDRQTMMTIWRRLADANHQQAKTQQAADAWQQAYQYYLQISESQEVLTAADQIQLADFLRFYAAWEIESGSPGVALQSLHMADDQCALAIAEDPTSQAARFMMCKVKTDLGAHYHRASNETAAKENYREALTLTGNFSETRAHLELRAQCLWKLGTLLLVDHRTIDQAESHYRGAVEIYDRLVEDYPWDVYYRGDLAALRHNLAVALRHQGGNEEARQLLDRAATGQSFTIKHKPKNADHQLFWAKHQWELGNVARDLQQFELAKRHYVTALDHFDKLIARWRNRRVIHEHKAHVHNDYAKMILSQPGVFGIRPVAQLAEEQIRQALKIFETLQEDFPDIKRINNQFPEISDYYSADLRHTYTKLAKSLNAQQRYDEGEAALRKAKAEFERVPRLSSPKARYEMADTLLDLAGTSLMRDDDPIKVENLYREGLQMLIDAFNDEEEAFDSLSYREELASHYWGLAQSLYEQKRFPEAKQEFERARQFDLLEPGSLSFYADNLMDCSDTSFQDFGAALECYLEVIEESSKRSDRKSDHSFIGQNLFRAGICHYRLQNFKQAKILFERLLSNPSYQDVIDFRLMYYMAMTLRRIDPSEDVGGEYHKSDAQDAYQIALEVHQQQTLDGKILTDKVDELDALRREAVSVMGIETETNSNNEKSGTSENIANESRDANGDPNDD